VWLPGDVGRATRPDPRAGLGTSGHCCPRGQGTVGVCGVVPPPVRLAAERDGHFGRLREGWGRGTHGGLAVGVGTCRCMGPQVHGVLGTRGCGAVGDWGHKAVGLTGSRVTGWVVQGSWGAVWLAGHSGSGHGAGLAGVQVPCAGGTVGCHMAPWLAGHCCDPVLGASVTLALATCPPGLGSWGGTEVKEGCHHGLCSSPAPAPALPTGMPAASLQAGIAAAPAGVPGPPRDPSVRACGRLRRAGGTGSAIWSWGPGGPREPVRRLRL